MNVTIYPHPLKGTLTTISSKSLSHRYLIASSLANGRSRVDNILDSDDLMATRSALSHFGITFDRHFVHGGLKTYDKKIIDCYESGSTLRFMIPLAMLFQEDITLTGRGRLPKRPLGVYKDLFLNKHVIFQQPKDHELPLTLRGPLRGGRFILRGDISSQFITGLLFALPLLSDDSVIELSTPLESKSYVDLTLDVLRWFGIRVLDVPPFYYVPGNQDYQPREVTVEGDYSQAAFFLVAGLLSGPITLTNLSVSSRQGDRFIIDILKNMGGKIDVDGKNQQVTAHLSTTHGITIDLSDVPDLGPVLMALAAVSKGTTHFIHAKRLRIKESDRIESMEKALQQLGVDIRTTDDDVWINGRESLDGDVVLDGCRDHRIVMALSILAMKAKAKITIIGAEAIEKSYPNFFKDYRYLGGVVDET